MAREIKFRSLYEGVWYYQTLEEMLTITLAAFRNGEHKTQYTGLKDKNGDEIYEGDIVVRNYYHNNPPSKRPKIKFISAKLPVIFDKGKFTLDDYDIRMTDYGTTFNNWWGDGCEVIGNIYENS